MEEFIRGSEWRKWDLHLHTPASYDYKDKSITNQQIIDSLITNEIALAVVTDHHIIDVDNYFELVALSQNKINFLPGVELRTDLGGSESIHIVAIFPEPPTKKALFSLWQSLSVKLSITEEQVKTIGHDKIYVKNFELATGIIKEYGGLISIHAGGKSNSVENISNALDYKMAQKTEIANIVDFYEIGSIKDKEGYIQNVFPIIGKYIPLVRGSDNHDVKNYENKLNTWIKADLTFEGLKQITREPESRTYVGDCPDKLKDITLNKTKYIDKLGISSKDTSQKWFEDEILFNSELISIIGNKGSGKSALSDIIGLLGNSYNFEHCSFLKEKKFYETNVAQNHFAKLQWKNQTNEDFESNEGMHLKSEINKSSIEKVQYIPQSYFEKVCNLTDEKQKEFKKEVEKVIFSHLDDSEKQGADNFDELIKIKRTSIERKLGELIPNINNEVEKFINYENILSKKFRELNESEKSELYDQSLTIQSELGALVKVPKPDDTDDKTKIAEIVLKIEEKEKESSKFKEELSKHSLQLTTINSIIENIEIFERQYIVIKDEIEAELKELNINVSEILELKIDKTSLNAKMDEIKKNKHNCIELIEKLNNEIKELNTQKEKEEDSLSGEAKNYQDYINNKTMLEKRLNEILGDEKEPLNKKDTYHYYKYLCSPEYKSYIEGLKQASYDKIKEFSGEIFILNLELKDTYELLKQNIDKFIDEFGDRPEDKIKIDFNPVIKIKKNSFEERMMNHIAKENSFRGKERENVFKSIYDISLSTKEDFLEMCELFLNFLRDDDGILSALKENETQDSVYNFLFGGEYLKVDYELEFNQKPISMLSPGERGLLLLTFFLLADKSNTPLILDQPEENLDNQTIFNVLVKLIKNAKKQRQVIIVTHNPNLAVVCDSEQIIYADYDALRTPKIKYFTGSIENDNINKKIVDILEGTMPAFRNRENKYIDA